MILKRKKGLSNSQSMEKFYITTPIYYANDKPHIGHAYTTVLADVLARWNRMQDKKVFFSAGMDEHGLKIQRKAEELNKDPQVFVNEIAAQFKDLWGKLNISYDAFIRTTGERHKKTVEVILNELYKRGSIYKGVYKGLYCVGCEQFLTKSQLVDGKCPDHNKEPEILEEENYLLKMSVIQKDLLKKLESDELKIIPETRKNEIISFLRSQNLNDISISRNKKDVFWGIELPFDKNYVVYVWIDAFLNYLTVFGWDGGLKNIPEFFPPDMQLMSKDILRVHATIWLAMLMHLNLPLSKKFYVHGYILSEGRKMSKTLGNVIGPLELINEYGTDAVRYYLLREITPFDDGDITKEKFKEAYNANLANGLGNLVSRIMKMSEKYLESREWKVESGDLSEEYKNFMGNYELSKAMDLIWKKISKLDLKIQETQPFKLIKTEPEKAKEILRELVSGLNQIAIMLKPFLPETSEKIIKAIEVNKMPEPLFLRKE